MPLRKSPVRTSALLAANRANAQDCRGPRSPQGKARVALNALQHGRYAVCLRENLVQAGDRGGESQYQWFRSEIATAFGASRGDEELQAEQMAARAWCAAREARRLGTKPESALESVIKEAWYTSLLHGFELTAGVLGAAAQVLDAGPGGAASLRSESTPARVGGPRFLTPGSDPGELA